MHRNKVDQDVAEKLLKKVAMNRKHREEHSAARTELGELLAKKGYARLALPFLKAHFYRKKHIKAHTVDELREIGDITMEEIRTLKSICGYATFETTPVGKLLESKHLSMYSRAFYKNGYREVRALDYPDLEAIGVKNETHKAILHKLFNSAV